MAAHPSTISNRNSRKRSVPASRDRDRRSAAGGNSGVASAAPFAWPVRGHSHPPPDVDYRAISFEVTGTQADAWGDALLEAGALSVDVEDADSGTDRETALYAGPGGDADPARAWARERLVALFPGSADATAALAAASAALGLPMPPRHHTRVVAEQDWVRLTQAQFAPIRIHPRLWIVPGWCEPVDPRAINVSLDPGLAFGTGSHATTRLCLRWLVERVRPGVSVLDYGCGSGILAIAARMLGAARVVGVDVDAAALAASRDNAARNGVEAEFLTPDRMGGETFDLVVANILARPLHLLAPLLAQRVSGGGAIALAGILDPQAAALAATYGRWFTIARFDSEEGWTVLSGERAPSR